MANVLFSRTSDPSSKPITDGQLIFDTSGNGKMYLDVGSERMEMGGARTVDPVLDSSSENPIQNKAVAGVMLDNLSDINNVTSKGFLADALAIKELNSNLNEVISGSFTESGYTVDYCYVGNICNVKVYRNQVSMSDVMLSLTQKLPKKPKYDLNVQNYRGVNSYLRINIDGGIYIEHVKSDNIWFNATITFVCV